MRKAAKESGGSPPTAEPPAPPPPPPNPLPFEVNEELKRFVRYGKGLIDGGGYKTARIVAYAGVEHVNSAERGRPHDATVISVQGVYLGGKQVAALLGRLHFEILRGVRGVRDGGRACLQRHEEELDGIRARGRQRRARAKQLQGWRRPFARRAAKREHGVRI